MIAEAVLVATIAAANGRSDGACVPTPSVTQDASVAVSPERTLEQEHALVLRVFPGWENDLRAHYSFRTEPADDIAQQHDDGAALQSEGPFSLEEIEQRFGAVPAMTGRFWVVHVANPHPERKTEVTMTHVEPGLDRFNGTACGITVRRVLVILSRGAAVVPGRRP